MNDASSRSIELLEAVLGARSFDAFGAALLSALREATGSARGLVYISDPRLRASIYADHGISDGESTRLQEACREAFSRLLEEDGAPSPRAFASNLTLRPLPVDGRLIGLIGFDPAEDAELPAGTVAALARVADNLADRVTAERKLLHLNTYLTVSSMLSRSVDLEELLEVALYASMEAVSAEAASILLLDEAKENFRFFRVEGTAKPLLGGTTFPATEGVAGRVLQTREAEIVNNAEGDEQFYGEIDLETGFRTRNMIAAPLIAADEPIGVLEVLNHGNGDAFSADERLILVSVADEVAFAVRNATLFDYVISTYCKRRQGQSSCKGCERPLGSWTPCVRYREFQP